MDRAPNQSVGNCAIPPIATLVFDVELVAVQEHNEQRRDFGRITRLRIIRRHPLVLTTQPGPRGPVGLSGPAGRRPGGIRRFARGNRPRPEGVSILAGQDRVERPTWTTNPMNTRLSVIACIGPSVE